MAKIEDHKYSLQEAFNQCFYIVPIISASMFERKRRSNSYWMTLMNNWPPVVAANILSEPF